MKKAYLLGLSAALVAVMSGCGSSDDSGSGVNAENADALFIYHNLTKEQCNATTQYSQQGFEFKLIEYTGESKDCADFGRKEDAYAMTNACIVYDVGSATGGTCVVGANYSTGSSDIKDYGKYYAPERLVK